MLNCSCTLAVQAGAIAHVTVSFIYGGFLHSVMTLKFKCRDVGFDCGWTTKGKTEDEILSSCAAHATKDHNMKPEEITEELKTKIKANIHKSFF